MGRILLPSVADLAKISNFMKNSLVGSELFHEDERRDEQTDGSDEPSSRFSQFCERPKKFYFLVIE